MQEYYTLIKPIPDDREHTNEFVHGITPVMVEDAPNFKKVFPIIAELIGDVIDKVYNYTAPDFVMYEFIGIKGGGGKTT